MGLVAAIGLALLPIVAPVFAIAGLGYLWVRGGFPYDSRQVTELVSRIGAPCLIFTTLATLQQPAEIALSVGLAAVLMVLGAMGVGLVVLPWVGLPRRTFLAPLMFTNSGNLGLSVCLFAFAAAGLELGIVYFTAIATLHFTLGILIWSGSAHPGPLLRTPFPYAVAAGIAVPLTGAPVPDWVFATTSLLGDMTIPLMLFALGAAAAQLRVVDLGATLRLVAVKFAIGFALAVSVVEVLALDGVARGVVMIQAVMPTPVFAALFAERYRRNPAAVASVVLVSTAASLLLLPLMLTYLLLP